LAFSYPPIRIKDNAALCSACGFHFGTITVASPVLTGVGDGELLPSEASRKSSRSRLVFHSGWKRDEEQKLFRLTAHAQKEYDRAKRRGSRGDESAQRQLSEKSATHHRRAVVNQFSGKKSHARTGQSLEQLDGTWRARCADCGLCNQLLFTA